MWQIKLAVCQLLGARKYSVSYRIVRTWKLMRWEARRRWWLQPGHQRAIGRRRSSRAVELMDSQTADWTLASTAGDVELHVACLIHIHTTSRLAPIHWSHCGQVNFTNKSPGSKINQKEDAEACNFVTSLKFELTFTCITGNHFSGDSQRVTKKRTTSSMQLTASFLSEAIITQTNPSRL